MSPLGRLCSISNGYLGRKAKINWRWLCCGVEASKSQKCPNVLVDFLIVRFWRACRNFPIQFHCHDFSFCLLETHERSILMSITYLYHHRCEWSNDLLHSSFCAHNGIQAKLSASVSYSTYEEQYSYQYPIEYWMLQFQTTARIKQVLIRKTRNTVGHFVT